MLRRFAAGRGGNFAITMVVATVPIVGGLALAVDYTEISRQRQATLSALDAVGVATARRIAEGADEAQATAYARSFFAANLGPVAAEDASLAVSLASSASGGGTLSLFAELVYRPYFVPGFGGFLGASDEGTVSFSARTEVRLKDTLEVALMLANSGSVAGEQRIERLKAAAKQLVDTIAAQAVHMKHVSKPVQFALLPFAASADVGPPHAQTAWIDAKKRSSFHHDSFDRASFEAPTKKALLANDASTTTPVASLVDVSTTAGLTAIKDAIDDVAPLGGTNVPLGIDAAPFTEGRGDEEGNDKVVIVLTDGGNTSAAVDQHMARTCDDAKAAGIVVVTVALDLSEEIDAHKQQIQGLKACASESRFRTDEDDPARPARLFWNATSGNLDETFEQIADELSNLRIVG